MVVVALVGMAGAGKTEATRFFVKAGFESVHFGGIVFDELKKKGLPLKEEFEKEVREELRKKLGMEAMALLSLPKIEALLAQKKSVVIEDMYSWGELLFLRKHFSDLVVVAILASPATRYARLSKRSFRQFSPVEAKARDIAEIENLQKGGPIAVADFNVLNDGTLKELEKQIKKIIKQIFKEKYGK